MILAKALFGFADGAKLLGYKICLSTDPVVQRISDWVKEEAVDCEVAPIGICLGVTEGHAGGSATIHVFGEKWSPRIDDPFLLPA